MKPLRIWVLLLALATPAAASHVYTMEVRGPIFTPVLEYLHIALQQAERERADAVLLELDTPGGSLDTTKDLVQAILGARVPVIVYVSPSGAGATSAGTFVTLAGHVAAMAPGTTIGAAHPVTLLPSDKPNLTMEKKVENYAVSLIEAIASQRGRNVSWAAEAVRDSASITAEIALEKKVIDLIAPSRQTLMAAIDGREVRVGETSVRLRTADPVFHDVEMTSEQRFYFFLAQPTVIFLLLVGGLAALYVEFTHPGVVAPGVTGAICLLLAAIGFSIVPVNWTGVALFGLGVILLVAELFVPSFGALGIGGLLCLLAGSLLLFHTGEAPGLVVNRGVIAATAVGFAALLLGVGTLVAKSQHSPVASGREAMIGATGVVRRRLEPCGKVALMGELWDAELRDGGSAEAGTAVEVVAIDGLRLVVAPRRRV
ncbi:MAG: nodulation protein NfeD [Deltaproteobacteria bacterium]|nr:nodulation protein NfeD [Deltaproteobacteria bacterium]